MTLVEAAEAILGKSASSALTAREITELAMKDGLIKPKSAKPWVHMQSAIRERNQQLLAAGKKEQFSFVAGKWKLN
jgi:HB1, ASXL, restriction endonuclease HTH domain